MIKDIISLAPVPPMARLLGFAGLIPFLSGGVIGWLPLALDVQLGVSQWIIFYAALIVSFLGGVRWGTAMQHNQAERLIPSVIPSLLAWTCLALPSSYAALLLALLLALYGAEDIRAARRDEIAQWYAPLRFWLSLGASSSMFSLTFWLFRL